MYVCVFREMKFFRWNGCFFCFCFMYMGPHRSSYFQIHQLPLILVVEAIHNFYAMMDLNLNIGPQTQMHIIHIYIKYKFGITYTGYTTDVPIQAPCVSTYHTHTHLATDRIHFISMHIDFFVLVVTNTFHDRFTSYEY